jgi:hypothetical protein
MTTQNFENSLFWHTVGCLQSTATLIFYLPSRENISKKRDIAAQFKSRRLLKKKNRHHFFLEIITNRINKDSIGFKARTAPLST